MLWDTFRWNSTLRVNPLTVRSECPHRRYERLWCDFFLFSVHLCFNRALFPLSIVIIFQLSWLHRILKRVRLRLLLGRLLKEIFFWRPDNLIICRHEVYVSVWRKIVPRGLVGFTKGVKRGNILLFPLPKGWVFTIERGSLGGRERWRLLKISCQASSVLLIRRERWWRCLIILDLFLYSSKSFCKFWILVKNRRRRWCVVIIGGLCGTETEKRGRRRRSVVFYSLLCRGTWGRLPGENHIRTTLLGPTYPVLWTWLCSGAFLKVTL